MSQRVAGTCITIGNFDGFHLGHQSLVAYARKVAAAKNLDFRLITFWPHPRAVLRGAQSHKALTGRSERARLLDAAGIANVVELPFTADLASMPAEEFVRDRLCPAGMKALVIGHDFTLGRGRQGGAQVLSALGERFGFAVSQAPPFAMGGAPISSTRLRQAIAAGDVETAARMLGRNYAVGGVVGHGFRRGTSLGFPTANLVDPDALLPGNGVYATFAILDGVRYPSVTNIGYNPTFGNAHISTETFLLEGSPELYGRPLRLEFLKRLRDERRFESPAALAAQIGKDIEAARMAISAAG